MIYLLQPPAQRGGPSSNYPDTDMTGLALTFAVCTLVIVVSATGLSRYADRLAEMTGIGRVWIGMTAVAISTSLPELSAGLSAVLYARSPNIAMGDVLGSCVFNLAIIALIDFMTPGEPMRIKLGTGHLISAGFGVVLISIVLTGLTLPPVPAMSVMHISLISPVIICCYIVASRITFKFEQMELDKPGGRKPGKQDVKPDDRAGALVMLVACAVVVGISGSLLPKIGVELADGLGVGRGFVGSVFLALSTSLPELTVAVACVRFNTLDIAVGNIFGSNIFNCVVLSIDDIVYLDGSIYDAAAPGQAITASIALAMTGVAIVGMVYKSSKRMFIRMGWDSAALVALYAANVVTSYYFSGGR